MALKRNLIFPVGHSFKEVATEHLQHTKQCESASIPSIPKSLAGKSI
jgi:hypothetical protein